MSDVLFYHLTQTPLEATLPNLLEKSLERGWSVCVQGTQREQLENLDRHLWTFRDDSFLPHGLSWEDHSEHQNIILSDQTVSKADVLMLIDGAWSGVESFSQFERVCLFFDGSNEEAVDKSRGHWKEVKDAGLEAKYWAQEEGTWRQKA